MTRLQSSMASVLATMSLPQSPPASPEPEEGVLFCASCGAGLPHMSSGNSEMAAALRKAQATIVDLQAQVQLLNQKNTEAADKLADCEDEISRLRGEPPPGLTSPPPTLNTFDFARLPQSPLMRAHTPNSADRSTPQSQPPPTPTWTGGLSRISSLWAGRRTSNPSSNNSSSTMANNSNTAHSPTTTRSFLPSIMRSGPSPVTTPPNEMQTWQEHSLEKEAESPQQQQAPHQQPEHLQQQSQQQPRHSQQPQHSQPPLLPQQTDQPSRPPSQDAVSALEQAAALTEALNREQALRRRAEEQSSKLNQEMEELSAALFQEANEMVAQERQRAAQLEQKIAELEERCAAVDGDTNSKKVSAPAYLTTAELVFKPTPPKPQELPRPTCSNVTASHRLSTYGEVRGLVMMNR